MWDQPLYPHQERALEKLHNGSILWGGTGTGKSKVAAHYYVLRETPRNVLVITTAKKRDSLDWDEEFARLGVGRCESVHGGTLTVDSWNNIAKYKDLRDWFIIFDEQRLVGSGEWVKTFIVMARHNRWILLSATPGDTWLDYVPVFVANGFYRNRTEFKREHVVYDPYARFPKVAKYNGVGKLTRLKNQLLVEMPYMRHTTRHSKVIKVDYDQDLFKKVVKKRWHVFENRPLRDVSELFSVMRKVVNSDSSRLDRVSSLLEQHPRLIVFYNFDYELEILRSLQYPTSSCSTSVPSSVKNSRSGSRNRSEKRTNESSNSRSTETGHQNPLSGPTSAQTTESVRTSGESSTVESVESQDHFMIAEWNGHKHQPIPKTDSWIYLVQYTAGSESWNCTDTDAMVFYSLTYSYKQFHQAHGRIDRLNTPFTDLYYYILMSDSDIDRAVKKSLDAKKSFNESDYVQNAPTRT